MESPKFWLAFSWDRTIKSVNESAPAGICRQGRFCSNRASRHNVVASLVYCGCAVQEHLDGVGGNGNVRPVAIEWPGHVRELFQLFSHARFAGRPGRFLRGCCRTDSEGAEFSRVQPGEKVNLLDLSQRKGPCCRLWKHPAIYDGRVWIVALELRRDQITLNLRNLRGRHFPENCKLRPWLAACLFSNRRA